MNTNPDQLTDAELNAAVAQWWNAENALPVFDGAAKAVPFDQLKAFQKRAVRQLYVNAVKTHQAPPLWVRAWRRLRGTE